MRSSSEIVQTAVKGATRSTTCQEDSPANWNEYAGTESSRFVPAHRKEGKTRAERRAIARSLEPLMEQATEHVVSSGTEDMDVQRLREGPKMTGLE